MRAFVVWRASWVGGLALLSSGAFATEADWARSAAAANQSYNEVINNLQNIQGIGSSNRSDVQVISTYYNSVFQKYVYSPLFAAPEGNSLDAVAQSTRSVASGLEDFKKKFWNNPAKRQIFFDSCSIPSLEDDLSAANKAADAIDNLTAKLRGGIDSRNPWTSSSNWNATNFDKQLKSASALADAVSTLPECCAKVLGNTAQCGFKDISDEASRLKTLLSGPAPRIGSMPDPLQYSGLSPSDLAYVLRDSNITSTLRRLRNRKGASSDSETVVFEELQNCVDRAKRNQNRAQPMSKVLLSGLGKTVKCNLLPALSTYSWNTIGQKLALAFAAVPMEGEGWDANCDEDNIAVWNSMRSMDANQISQKWGLPQLANPPYIANMRTVPPLSASFASSFTTAEELMRYVPNGSSYLPDKSATSGDRSSSKTSSRFASGGSATVATSDRASTGSRFASAGARNFISRGASQGQGLVQAVRVSSASIQKGERAEYYANQIRSAATSTRNFVSSASTRLKATGTASLRAASSKEASSVRNFAVQASAARLSSTAAKATVSALSTRVSSTSAAKSTTTTKAANEAQRKQIMSMVQGYVDTMSMAKTQGEETRKKIAELISQRDAIYADLEGKIYNKPDRKISELILDARRQSGELDREIGALKATYQGYQTSLTQSEAFVQRLMTFGPTANTLGNAGTAPTGYPRGYNAGSSRFDTSSYRIFDFLLNTAWALTAAQEETQERHWAEEWQRFKKDLDLYAQGLSNEDKKYRKEAGTLVSQRLKRVSGSPVSEIDTDSLVAMKLMTDEILDESDYLIENSESKKIRISAGVLDSLRQTRSEALESQKAFDAYNRSSMDLIPRSQEENPDVWWGLVSDLLLF